MRTTRAVSLVLVVILALSSVSTVFAAVEFKDVKPTDCFYKDVMNLVEKGIVSGYPEGTFKPNNNVTNADDGSI